MSSMHQINMSIGDGGAVHMPPKEAVYSDLLSLGVSARKSHVEFAAQAGGGYKPSSRNVVEIPISVGDGQWVDFSNHYLKMKIDNNSKVAAGADTAKGAIYYTAHDFIQRLQILGTNSELLEDVTDYNKIARMLQLHQLDGADANTQNELGGFKPIGEAVFVAAPTNLIAGQTVCFQLISGVLNAQKYFPLGMARNRSLTIRIELAPALTAIATTTVNGTATGAADDRPDYTISEVSLGCDVISMSDSYNMKFRAMLEQMGSINIHYTTYKGYQNALTGTGGTVIIPDSSRSLKSIFTCFLSNAPTVITDSLALINPALTNYIYNVNSHSYPSSNVVVATVGNTSAAFAQLHTALGGISSSKTLLGRGEFTGYDVNAFAIGACTESFNRSSNVLESGENLSQSSNPIRLQLTTGVDCNAFSFTLSDRLISFDASGSLTSSG